MGLELFKNGAAHRHIDDARFLSDRERREALNALAADDAKWTAMATQQYADCTNRVSGDVEQVLRICEAAERETVPGILEDLRSGTINATEAARLLGAARRDLAKLRKAAEDAERAEAQTWEAINTDPAGYQESLMQRAPMLFRNGQNLLALPTAD